jgi:hypothetical protein
MLQQTSSCNVMSHVMCVMTINLINLVSALDAQVATVQIKGCALVAGPVSDPLQTPGGVIRALHKMRALATAAADAAWSLPATAPLLYC